MSVPALADSPEIGARLDRLLSLHPKRIDLTLGRVERLLAALGRPEHALPPVVHVAGTNGKGSVIAFLRAIFEAAGQRAHVYTSPHLVSFRERIVLGREGGGAPISEEALLAFLEEAEAANSGEPITFFEITTAAALLAFARTPGDVLLLETGLGGRLDATNVVVRPAATVITPIGIDHQDFLGESLAEIAREKAGILKPGVPSIIAPQAEEALGVIEAEAARIGAPLFVYNRDWQVREERGQLVYEDEQGLLDLPQPRLLGRHQVENAGTAIAACRVLSSFQISQAQISAGLRDAEWPARFERLGAGPLAARIEAPGTELWLDGGHNVHGARAVAETLADLDERVPKPLHLIVGMMGNKDAEGFLAAFRGLARSITAVPVPRGAGADPIALAALASDLGFNAGCAESVPAALDQLKSACGPHPVRVLICGSLYLAGEVLRLNGR